MKLLEEFVVDGCVLRGEICWAQGWLRLDMANKLPINLKKKEERERERSRYRAAIHKAVKWIARAILDTGEYEEFSMGLSHVTVNARTNIAQYEAFCQFVQEALEKNASSQMLEVVAPV